MSKLDAVGFGALNVDKLFKVNRIAVAEEESFVVDHSEACGGSAANTMVALARLGCKVGFIGKVASDAEGRMLLQDFRKEGVDTRGVTVATTGRSGKVMGFVGKGGERALYIDPGVNDTIRLDQIDSEYASSTRFLHLSSFVGKQSFETQKKIVGQLPKEVRVSFDPGALYAGIGLTKLEPIIDKTSVMMPNAGEIALLTGKTDYKAGARLLIDEGVEVLAVKLGSKGCYVIDRDESHLVEPFKVKVVDTTGAGDAFDAGFIFGLLSGKNINEAGKIGNFVASRSITAMGARSGLPTLSDLKKLGMC
ncbi:MAG: carbohydrate kinase family protein [Candidatus Bathyarchaeia archaeon]